MNALRAPWRHNGPRMNVMYAASVARNGRFKALPIADAALRRDVTFDGARCGPKPQ